MQIKSLYRDYFQKSRIFLYPGLDIKRGTSTTPIETYSIWQYKYSLEDKKLICLYHLRNDKEFRTFEQNKLFGNKMFYDFKQTEDGRGIYIFDFSKQGEDWKNFQEGKYSMISQEQKRKIKNYYGTNSPNYAYIESFLHPEKYFRLYSDMLGVREKVLKEVGELCEKPDFDKETLEISIKNLEISN
jgi:hypothetical protein